MQQWEYKIEIVDLGMVALKEYLNKAGADGWELCFFQHNTQGKGECIFKRPIPQPTTAEKIFNDVKNEVEGIPKAAFDEHPPCTCGTDELCRIHSV